MRKIFLLISITGCPWFYFSMWGGCVTWITGIDNYESPYTVRFYCKQGNTERIPDPVMPGTIGWWGKSADFYVPWTWWTAPKSWNDYVKFVLNKGSEEKVFWVGQGNYKVTDKLFITDDSNNVISQMTPDVNLLVVILIDKNGNPSIVDRVLVLKDPVIEGFVPDRLSTKLYLGYMVLYELRYHQFDMAVNEIESGMNKLNNEANKIISSAIEELNNTLDSKISPTIQLVKDMEKLIPPDFKQQYVDALSALEGLQKGLQKKRTALENMKNFITDKFSSNGKAREELEVVKAKKETAKNSLDSGNPIFIRRLLTAAYVAKAISL